MDGVLSNLLYLNNWPDFARESDLTVIADQARVCALLARRPAAGFLVSRNVGLSQHETEEILDHLLEMGCLSVFQENFISLAGERRALPEKVKRPSLPRPGTQGDGGTSFLGRLWKKLVFNTSSS